MEFREFYGYRKGYIEKLELNLDKFGIFTVILGIFLLESREMTSHNGASTKPNASSNFSVVDLT